MNLIKNKKGIALITVLILLLVVGVLTSALMVLYTSNISRAGSSAERNKAFYAAEAGANYLNAHINKNTKKINIVFQPIMEGELRNLTGDLTDEFLNEFDSLDSNDFDNPNFKFGLADDLKINGFDLSFSFDESSLKREDEIYGLIIEANNGRISEKIRLIYEVETLPPFFRSSRQANKITIDDDSSFTYARNFPAHSFATAEKYYYEKWRTDIDYNAGDIIYYKGNHYSAKENHTSKGGWYSNAPGGRWNTTWKKVEVDVQEPDLRKFDRLDNAVDYGMDVLPPLPPKQVWKRDIEYTKDEKVKHKEKFYISNVENPHTQPGVGNDWQEYINYEDEVLKIFDEKIKDKNHENNNITYSNSEKQHAYEKFLNETSKVGPFIKIDGDFTPTKEYTKNFDSTIPDGNGVVHVLVNGNVDIRSSVNFTGDKKVIMYINGSLNFDSGNIDMSGLQKNGGQLGYFAPYATFTVKNQGKEWFNNSFFGSSMIVNKFEIKNSRIAGVTYDTENSPLIGKMDPEIAELSRSFAAQHGDGVVSEINPIRQSWERIN